jgi:hypothetical protein
VFRVSAHGKVGPEAAIRTRSIPTDLVNDAFLELKVAPFIHIFFFGAIILATTDVFHKFEYLLFGCCEIKERL